MKHLNTLFAQAAKATIIPTIVTTALCFGFNPLHAQSGKKIATVINVDVRNLPITAETAGDMLRLELEKAGDFEVNDRYEISAQIKKNNIDVAGCYSKSCLVEVGKLIKSDKMMTGTAELLGDNLVITIRTIDVASNSTEKTSVQQFLNLPGEMQNMFKLLLAQMYGHPSDPNELNRLSKRFNYEDAINTPTTDRLRNDGPRTGFTILFDHDNYKLLKAPKSEGGFGMKYPMMFQFGYQFEISYLNEGNFQGLFEIIPVVSGMDHGLFIPSCAILNGFRFNKGGWEFAFGPNFSLIRTISGHEDSTGRFVRGPGLDEKSINRINSNGDLTFNTGFLIGFGKTIKSGRLNMPLNAYILPSNQGIRAGFSLGFNSHRRKTVNTLGKSTVPASGNNF